MSWSAKRISTAPCVSLTSRRPRRRLRKAYTAIKIHVVIKRVERMQIKTIRDVLERSSSARNIWCYNSGNFVIDIYCLFCFSKKPKALKFYFVPMLVFFFYYQSNNISLWEPVNVMHNIITTKLVRFHKCYLVYSY